MSVTLVELDSRRRLSLGKLATSDRYLVREESGGVLVLEPAVVVTAAQARLDARPDLMAKLVDALDHPERAVPRKKRPTRVSE